MRLRESELTRVVHDTWELMLGLPVDESSANRPENIQQEYINAAVHILGGWCGAVSVECSLPFAKKVACRVFDLTEQEATKDFIDSSFREIVNVTGGNLKSLLGDGCVLSVPKVIGCTDYCQSVPGCSPAMRMWFKSEENLFLVTVHKSDIDLDLLRDL